MGKFYNLFLICKLHAPCCQKYTPLGYRGVEVRIFEWSI
jgi:hypothetical protein